MDLIAKDFHFYPNGRYTSVSKRDIMTGNYTKDLEEITTNIRVFGTEDQIEETLNKLISKIDLALDECYKYELYKKDSYFYSKERNERIRKSLERLNKEYLLNNKQPLIYNI